MEAKYQRKSIIFKQMMDYVNAECNGNLEMCWLWIENHSFDFTNQKKAFTSERGRNLSSERYNKYSQGIRYNKLHRSNLKQAKQFAKFLNQLK